MLPARQGAAVEMHDGGRAFTAYWTVLKLR